MSSVVLGGGIAGLSATYYLSKLAKETTTLVEGSSRLGGWIRSVRSPNGTVFETGPRTMRLVGAQGTNTLELLEDLGLENDVRPVLRSAPAAKNRMLYVGGKLHSLPNSFSSIFKTVPPFSKPLALALFQDLRAPPLPLEDDSIHNFVSRRLGPEIADYAISALVCGVCAGDSKKISVNLLMASLFQWEQSHGGIARGLMKSAFTKSEATLPKKENQLGQRAKLEGWNVWSLSGGLEALPARLGQVLEESENVEINLKATCDKISFGSEGAELSINGQKKVAQHVYASIPCQHLAKILPPEHKSLQDELSAIPIVSVAVVNLEFSGNVLPMEGFGFLVPPNQNLPILGVIFDSCCFSQGDKTVLTVMMGGEWFQSLFGANPDPSHLLDIAVGQVKKALNLSQDPSDSMVSILKDCIPQYIVGHKARVDRIRAYIAQKQLPLTLLGSSYDGVGVNDVIYSARRGVEARLLR